MHLETIWHAIAANVFIDWFVKFPALWLAAGFIGGGAITGVVSVLVFRKYGNTLTNANDKLVGIQEKQLDMMERTLQMQKEHYEAEISECKRERQEYKDTLHSKREEWNAESIKMQLLIQELESRPDMTALGTAMTEVVKLIETVAANLDKHDKSVDERMTKFMAILATVKANAKR